MVLQEKLSNKNFHIYCSKKWNFRLRVPPEAPFYWKLLKINIHIIHSAVKDIKKMSPFYKFEGPPPPLPRLHRIYLVVKDFLEEV